MNAKELLNALNTFVPKLKETEPGLEVEEIEYHRDVISNQFLILVKVAYPSGERKSIVFDAETLKIVKIETIKGGK